MKRFILAEGIRGFLPREVTFRQSEPGWIWKWEDTCWRDSGRGLSMSQAKKLGHSGYSFSEVDEYRLDEDEQ